MVVFNFVFVMSKLEFDSNSSAFTYDGERHLYDSAVIVLNGHTYHLVVDVTTKVFIPCNRCALKPLCIHDGPAGLIERLCRECTPKKAGYWVEDRYPVQYTLEEICKKQNYEGYHSQYSCRTYDKPFYDKFE